MLPSTVAEIMRSGQKDKETIDYTLQPNCKRSLETVFSLFQRFVHQFDRAKQAKFLSKLGPSVEFMYYLMTTVAGNQTLGEEYVNIVQVDGTLGRHPNLLVRSFMVALHCFTPVLVAELVDHLKVTIDNTIWIVEEKKKLLKFILEHSSQATQWIYKLQRSLFFLGVRSDTVAKLFLSISYISLRRNSLPRYSGFLLIGYLGLLQCLISAYRATKNLLLYLRESNGNGKVADTDRSEVSGLPSVNKCPLCLNSYTAISCAPCGHLFCWLCIYPWCASQPCCPICREHCNPRDIVRLVNFSL